jgi:hypothetical protein
MAKSQVTIISPIGRSCEIPLGDSEVTEAFLRTTLVSQLKLTTHSPTMFRDGRVVPCGPVHDAADSTFAFISRPEFPERGYPRCDYAFLFDHQRFQSHAPVDDFPDTHPPGLSRAARDDSLRDLVTGISRELDQFPMEQLIREERISPQEGRAMMRRARQVSMTEEEDGVESAGVDADDEEEDMRESIYIKDDYEESPWPEQEQAVGRLAALGFDKSVCRFVLFMMEWDELQARRLLSQIHVPGRG